VFHPISREYEFRVAELKRPQVENSPLTNAVVARLRPTIDRYDSIIAAVQNALAIYFFAANSKSIAS
jgi:hypothetical protein